VTKILRVVVRPCGQTTATAKVAKLVHVEPVTTGWLEVLDETRHFHGFTRGGLVENQRARDLAGFGGGAKVDNGFCDTAGWRFVDVSVMKQV